MRNSCIHTVVYESTEVVQLSRSRRRKSPTTDCTVVPGRAEIYLVTASREPFHPSTHFGIPLVLRLRMIDGLTRTDIDGQVPRHARAHRVAPQRRVTACHMFFYAHTETRCHEAKLLRCQPHCAHASPIARCRVASCFSISSSSCCHLPEQHAVGHIHIHPDLGHVAPGCTTQ